MTDKPNSDEEPEFDWDTSDSSFDDYDSDWNHDNDPAEEGGMSFLEHLEEFRWTVGRSILAFSAWQAMELIIDKPAVWRQKVMIVFKIL